MTTATADYGIVTEAGAIRFERLLPGPIERVWAYLTDSEKRGTWLCTGEMDLKPGGAFEHVWRNNELTGHADDVAPPKHKDHVEHRMEGVVLEVDPPRLLIEQWDSGKENQSEVVFELVEQDDKVLTLTRRRTEPRHDGRRRRLAHPFGSAGGAARAARAATLWATTRSTATMRR